MRITPTGQTYALFVGVDIAATTATVSMQRPGATASRSCIIDQTPESSASLAHKLQATGAKPSSTLVVMEATGAYWISLATRLVHAGSVVRVINPAQTHHFAKALLKRAKTDAIDAQTLAQLALVLQAAQHKPVLKTLYTRLRAAGKPEKVARCAAARKLLQIAWAVVTKEQLFDPHYAQG
jgi:transposase